MSGSLNKVMLIGNLGRDPEVRTFSNGGRVCNLRIATTENWRDRESGERRERTEWHSVAIFSDGLIRVCEQYLRKGSKVFVEGQLQTRKWQDQNGNDRYTTEVAIRNFNGNVTFLDRRGDDMDRGGRFDSDSASRPQQDRTSAAPADTGFTDNDDLDDEIPF